MTKNLLVVFSRGAEEDICSKFLPYWRKSGCDIAISAPLDDPFPWHADDVRVFSFGKSIGPTRNTWFHLQSRMYDTFKYCLTLPYDGFVFTQFDSIALGPFPYIGPDDSVHRLAGGEAPGFASSFFLHPPWCFGNNRLKQFVEAADDYDIKTTEGGIADRWLSLIIERHCMPFEKCSWGWTANKIDSPELLSCARQAVKNGALFVHGVDNEKTLAALLE